VEGVAGDGVRPRFTGSSSRPLGGEHSEKPYDVLSNPELFRANKDARCRSGVALMAKISNKGRNE